MKKLIIPIISLMMLTSCVNSQGDVFGRKADAGALLGTAAGAAIGAYNGNVAKGALIGAGVGLAAGAVADANDARMQNQKKEVVVVNAEPPRAAQGQTEVVVVQRPVIIEERVWVGRDMWIYSRFGHIYYRDRWSR